MLYVSKEVKEKIDGPWLSIEESQRWAMIEADLAHFVEGGAVNDEYLWPLLDWPSRFEWEIKSRRPSPGIRILGRFAEQDVFIATNAEYRNTLGRGISREWNDAIESCVSCWERLFPGYPPLTDRDLSRCVTQNVYSDREHGG